MDLSQLKTDGMTHLTLVEVQAGATNIQHVEHYHTHDNNQEPLDAAPARCPLREAIEQMLPYLTQKRLWFPIVKVMMDCGCVLNGDFVAAKAMIEREFPEGLATTIDAADLSRLNVQSFARPVSGWDIANAPVQGNVFEKYRSIALRFSEIFK